MSARFIGLSRKGVVPEALTIIRLWLCFGLLREAVEFDLMGGVAAAVCLCRRKSVGLLEDVESAGKGYDKQEHVRGFVRVELCVFG